MKKIVVFSGAGVSAESGIQTFRDGDGLWESYNIHDVATPEAWKRNPELVLDFYNHRRKQVIDAQPNEAHLLLVELEKNFDVQIITQNIDDLHERAGSSKVIHLHGEIRKSRSTLTHQLYTIDGWQLNFGDQCPEYAQLRPHVVWFGEAVPAMDQAIPLCKEADLLIVIGTSLSVYPAANLIHFVPEACQKFLIDPKQVLFEESNNLTVIQEKASVGMKKLVEQFIQNN